MKNAITKREKLIPWEVLFTKGDKIMNEGKPVLIMESDYATAILRAGIKAGMKEEDFQGEGAEVEVHARPFVDR